MFTTEDLEKMKAAYEEWLTSKRRKPKQHTGHRGAYKYVKKEPSARTKARREREAALAEGVPAYLLPKDYDCGVRCRKCGSVMRYISSGTCSGCSKRLDLRTEEQKAMGCDVYNAKHQAEIDRKNAKERKEKRYEGLPCKVCGCTTRYTASTGCVNCVNAKSIKRRQDEIQKYHHDTSKLMFIKGHRQVPEVYDLCPALAAYPDYVLVFTDLVKPKRLVGTDAMLEPDLLTKYAHLFKQNTEAGIQPTEEEKIVVQYLTFEATQLAWKLFNQRKMEKKS